MESNIKIIPTIAVEISSKEVIKDELHHSSDKKSCCGDCKGNGSCLDEKIKNTNAESNIDIATEK